MVLSIIGVCMALLAWAPRWNTPYLLWLLSALALGSAWLAPSARPYPLLMWAALMVAGLLFQRWMPRVTGCAVGAVLFGADLALRWTTQLPPLLDATGHTGGLIDVIGSAGCAVSICSLCCLVQRRLRWLAPLGRMPLTVYCLHILTAQWLGIWASLTGAALISYAWLACFPRGPVETVIRRITAVVKEKQNEETRS